MVAESSVHDEEEYLWLSGLQHFAFCRRQWALIYLEQAWQENVLTFAGREFHERVDDPNYSESRRDRVITRRVPLVSPSLRLYGIADTVEFHRRPDTGVRLPGREGLWVPYPVEYKRGRPKSADCDRVQLCAQALCLEEMLGVEVPEGALYYGRTRHREVVAIDASLRQYTRELAAEMHAAFLRGSMPSAHYTKACDSCSLVEQCLPRLPRHTSVASYIDSMVVGIDQ